MAVKCLVVGTIILLLGVVCARELQLASKLKVDPGIFISLDTLRRLEAKAKNNATESDANTNTTPAGDDLNNGDDNDEIDKSEPTTTAPDNEDSPVSNDPSLETTNLDTIENQTNQPIPDTNDPKTEENANESVTSLPNDNTKNPNTAQQLYPNQATSQQALMAYQKIQWPIPQQQYPYGSEQQIYQQNPYQQLTYGAQRATYGVVPNQQNLGIPQTNQPVLFNQQLLYNYNEPQPFSMNPQSTFDPNQQYQQHTFLVQHPYPILSSQPSNQQMNLISMNPLGMPLPYSQMYQPVLRN